MVTKKTAKVPVNDVPSDKYFWMSDGRVLRNLRDLVNALESMDEKIFKHHVSGKKNDFAAWIKDVFGETKLATSIAKNKTASSIAKKIKSAI